MSIPLGENPLSSRNSGTYSGWSKMSICKAREVPWNEAYICVRRSDGGTSVTLQIDVLDHPELILEGYFSKWHAVGVEPPVYLGIRYLFKFHHAFPLLEYPGGVLKGIKVGFDYVRDQTPA